MLMAFFTKHPHIYSQIISNALLVPNGFRLNEIPLPCVTAAGLPAGNSRCTWGYGRSESGPVCVGLYGDSVRHGDEYCFTFVRARALTSPKGGGPCSLSTRYYWVASHLAFRLRDTY